MNDEIGEIYKLVSDELIEITYKDNNGSYIEKYIDVYELLDYITNLQKENEIRQQDINNLTYQLAKEKEENGKLKMRNDMLRKDINSFIEDNKIDYKARYENVINELEKWLKGLIDNFDDNVSTPILHEQMTIQMVYEYLENLKEEQNGQEEQ